MSIEKKEKKTNNSIDAYVLVLRSIPITHRLVEFVTDSDRDPVSLLISHHIQRSLVLKDV
jgi:hypothetical protein